MHFLVTILLLALVFPFLGRFFFSFVRGFFWLILALVVLAAVGAFVHR
jgi:hypothetical protein